MKATYFRGALLLLLWLSVAQARVRSRSASSQPNDAISDTTNPSASLPGTGHHTNLEIMDKLSWKCANNASCVYALANSALAAYRRGETVKLGIFEMVKLPPPKNKVDLPIETGRGLSAFMDFIGGNAIRIPVGPMVFSVQRAEDDANYIEIALLKKATNQGRRGGDGSGLLGGGGSEGGGGLLGGGGGGSGLGGGGNGGGGGILRHRKQEKQDKKQFEMYIPMYLAATTFGWTMVAAKAVGLLTLKALLISKLAFVVSAMVIIKKLMDNASENHHLLPHGRMMYQYPEHSPYMMPYSMDYPMHAMGGGSEMSSNDMYPAALHLAAAQQAHPGLENLGAESSVHHNFAEMQNNTQVLAALNAVGLGQKVKREDAWIGKTSAARRPLMYNYLQPHHPYYRASK